MKSLMQRTLSGTVGLVMLALTACESEKTEFVSPDTADVRGIWSETKREQFRPNPWAPGTFRLRQYGSEIEGDFDSYSSDSTMLIPVTGFIEGNHIHFEYNINQSIDGIVQGNRIDAVGTISGYSPSAYVPQGGLLGGPSGKLWLDKASE